MSFLSSEEIATLGVTAGHNVMVSRDALIFGADRLSIGDNVRIDALCVLSAGASGSIRLGSHIHIASGARMFGEGGITFGDFISVSSGSTIYSASDDFSGRSLIGPVIPDRWRTVDTRPVTLEDYSAVGAHSVVLPGVTLREGAVLGAASLARDNLESWTIYAGSPCRPLGARSRDCVQMSKDFLFKSEDRHN